MLSYHQSFHKQNKSFGMTGPIVSSGLHGLVLFLNTGGRANDVCLLLTITEKSTDPLTMALARGWDGDEFGSDDDEEDDALLDNEDDFFGDDLSKEDDDDDELDDDDDYDDEFDDDDDDDF